MDLVAVVQGCAHALLDFNSSGLETRIHSSPLIYQILLEN